MDKARKGLKRPFNCYWVSKPSKMTYPYIEEMDIFIAILKEFTPCPHMCISLNKASLRLSFEIEKIIIIAKKEMRLFWTYLFFAITCWSPVMIISSFERALKWSLQYWDDEKQPLCIRLFVFFPFPHLSLKRLCACSSPCPYSISGAIGILLLVSYLANRQQVQVQGIWGKPLTYDIQWILILEINQLEGPRWVWK